MPASKAAGKPTANRLSCGAARASRPITIWKRTIAKATGSTTVGTNKISDTADAAIAQCAGELLAAKGKSVVMCGSNDVSTQILVNSINSMLGNYGSTIDLQNATFYHQGDDGTVAQLIKDMNAGSIGAILIANTNPAYSLPNAEEFKAGLKKVGTSICFNSHADETASLCNYITPDHHWLESWNDLNPKPGHYAMVQPTIRPLFDTRQWGESLLKWSGVNTDWHTFVQDVAQSSMPVTASLLNSWDQCVHDGVYNGTMNSGSAPTAVRNSAASSFSGASSPATALSSRFAASSRASCNARARSR